MIDVFRKTPLRIAIAFTIAVSIVTIISLEVVYANITTLYEKDRTRTIERETNATIAETQDHVRDDLAIWLEHGFLFYSVAGLFDPAGGIIAGNLNAIPQGLPLDGQIHNIELAPKIVKGGLADKRMRQVLVAGVRRSDGTILVMGRTLSEVTSLRYHVLDLFLGATSVTLVGSLSLGLWMSVRSARRLRNILDTIARVMDGHLNERLPSDGSSDDLDRLTLNVNRMLDMIERLLDDMKGVSDNIAHDLRTPLSVVRAQLERAIGVESGEAELRNTIRQALMMLDRALVTITALLRLAEIENWRRRSGFSQINLAEICQEAYDFYRPLAEERNISLTCENLQSLVIAGDAELLFEAVTNLLDNAIKFTPAGGRVIIQAIDDGSSIIVSVSDTGPGIPAIEHDNIGKRFYRADKSRHMPGTGLGLSLTIAICELHGFSLKIEDNLVGGATFKLVKPKISGIWHSLPPVGTASRLS